MELLDIINGCKIKDSLLQQILFEKYYPKIKGVCIRYCGDNKMAEDMATNGFILAFNLIKRFNGTTEKHFITWFKKLMIDEHIASIKKTGVLKEVESDFILEDITEVSDTAFKLNDIEINDILLAMDSLSIGQRTIFNMHSIDGFAITVASKKCGISHECGHARYSSAIKKIKFLCVANKKLEKVS